MLYSCTHMATVGFKGLRPVSHVIDFMDHSVATVMHNDVLVGGCLDGAPVVGETCLILHWQVWTVFVSAS